jgi:carbamoyltransferase
MNIIGLSGSLKLTYEASSGERHDAAAVLVMDGKVVSAMEEERLCRIKHTDKFPINAIRFVLEQNNLSIEDIDQFCYYSIQQNYVFENEQPVPLVEKIQTLLNDAFGCDIDKKKIYFVHHHLAHAVSTFYMSGFDKSLVISIDGVGDKISGLVMNAEGKNIKKLDTLSEEDSLGIYYLNVIYILGYKQFDEYKVMGLAPYGDPATYRDLFKTFYTLLPDGKYQIHLNQVKKSYLITPRRQKDEPFTKVHEDIAAALQESLEDIVMHMVKHYREKYGHQKLCLAGGVAHNCSMNGRILYSGLFDDIFVQPASHDAGCALGSALYRYYELNPQETCPPLEHLYWGAGIGDSSDQEQVLAQWKDFISYEAVDNAAQKTAQLLADGAVIGWVQGRSEFGPRALGNRSIVADPRPPENKDIINEMVKKREGYRPFAPSLLEEYLHDYYDIPSKNGGITFPYMIFVVDVHEDKQKLLGAITHVDGTARIQTVSKQTNPKYWELIDEFRKITGVPIVLNTSFNNNAEPIVDSVNDAVVCFYTTKLNYLVVGDFLVKKKEVDPLEHLKLAPSLPVYNILTQTNRYVSWDKSERYCQVENNFENGYHSELSTPVYNVLNQSDGKKTLASLLDAEGITGEDRRREVVSEVIDLWTRRFIRLQPV